jgi:uncharacterized protein
VHPKEDPLLDLLYQDLQKIGLETGLFCLFVVFVAAVIRGFTGFGSALLWVPTLSLVLPPVAVVPVVLVLEAFASAMMFSKVRQSVDWSGLTWIWIGAAIVLPLGIWLLATLPVDVTRTAIAVTVLAAAVLLWRGIRLQSGFGKPGLVGTGGLAGLLTGLVGIPGPPVFLYYLAAPVEMVVARATIMTYLFGPAFVACIINYVYGLLLPSMILLAVMLMPVVAVGKWVGHLGFKYADPDIARKVALGLLVVSGLGLLVRTYFF